MRILTALVLSVAALIPLGTAEAASYKLFRPEDSDTTRYGGTDWQVRYYEEDYIYASPYRSVTHALHPYYRNTYYTRQATTPCKITRPEFYQYLEDLYYNGQLVPAQPAQAPQSRCYNYTVQRTSQRSPRLFTGCN
ncbi:MAG: hypothetical protein PHO92_00700 [Candidatus Peribacteraceae bacterium]|nr:hypothetical protein [Candidatus Peribacteraceae bacterium]